MDGAKAQPRQMRSQQQRRTTNSTSVAPFLRTGVAHDRASRCKGTLAPRQVSPVFRDALMDSDEASEGAEMTAIYIILAMAAAAFLVMRA